ncbi:hypothetical protein CHS0354_019287 [Potamilus streckersoni]|uniref:Uncharacterized protein n=1 Tax=Potamilus streckersoni TaxID=2493646 RepID=A0AAE0SHF5_9BIVA|nr:hypothetical protein CHS0354_019287 [Potamilus streckersoni]
MADIDPDGPDMYFFPVQVECDFDSEPGKALTVLHHDSENRIQVKGYEGAGEYQILLKYDIGWAAAIKVVDLSAECKQYMKWECFAAVIHNPNNEEVLTTFWKNRTEGVANYFGGAEPGSGKCACGMTHSCVNETKRCNCDNNDYVWRFDDGFITHKSELPMHSFYAGDTGKLCFLIIYFSAA